MKAIDKHQIILISTLIKKLNIDTETKEELIMTFTDNRTASRSLMYSNEAIELIVFLNNMLKNKSTTTKYVPTDGNDHLRKKIISIFREMNYNLKGKADMERIQNTLLKYWKKQLNDYTKEELSKIISVLETQWLKNYYKNK